MNVENFERVSFEAQRMCGENIAGLHFRAPLVCNAASREKHFAGSVTPAACDVVWRERHSVGSVTALDKHGAESSHMSMDRDRYGNVTVTTGGGRLMTVTGKC